MKCLQLALQEDDKQPQAPQLVPPRLNNVLFCSAYKWAVFLFCKYCNVCVHFVTVNHCGIPARNDPVTVVLPYIQYQLPRYYRKSCPHLGYYHGNFTKKSPLPRFSRGNGDFTAVISPLQVSNLCHSAWSITHIVLGMTKYRLYTQSVGYFWAPSLLQMEMSFVDYCHW